MRHLLPDVTDPFVWGPALLGVVFAVGVLLLLGARARTLPNLARRVAEGGIAGQGERPPAPSWVCGPVLGLLESIGSTSATVERRLTLLGQGGTLPVFRLRQTLLALFGAVGAVVVLLPVVLRSGMSPASGGLVLAVMALGALCAAAAADLVLSWRARARQRRIDLQVPDVSELLALALGAGESVPDALDRIRLACSGPVREELDIVSEQVHLGVPVTRALEDLSARNEAAALERLVQTLVTAIERGSPLAQVLHDQARDIRESARTALMEEGGKREIAMMVPVVFLILPVTVLFALYPGLVVVSLSP
ncbi:type II secretion system F family protein [Schaalia sp. 19OD2882]|uniref:type II secretion system F family protein n=1 Tax=Schaalia sp. 19OD2882 TaxID=2794089 RepID=UPI001C1F0EEA|nr:type II secretion system F family protein [Schaalia sp. 19OD2882]QWW20096.1 type II secretion system F family protein [Schaalia sp. 19OD2882]